MILSHVSRKAIGFAPASNIFKRDRTIYGPHGRKEEEEPPGRGEATDAANGGRKRVSQTESRCEISALVK